MTDYLITELDDGFHVRVLAAARTTETAYKKFAKESRARWAAGQTFFSPVRRVRGGRSQVHGMLDRDVAALPTWGDDAP